MRLLTIILLFLAFSNTVYSQNRSEDLWKQRKDSIENGETKPTNIRLPEFDYVGRFDIILYTDNIGKVHGIKIEDKYNIPVHIKNILKNYFKKMQFTNMKNMRVVFTITKLNNK